MEKGLTKNEILATLSKSPHGKLEEYVPIGVRAAKEEPEFLAHLVAWNQVRGQIRDSKVALPVISLSVPTHNDFVQNALAHIALLDPRNLIRAVRFSKQLKAHTTAVRHLVYQYLTAREANWARWEKTAVQHRASLKELYALCRVKPSHMADAILFKGQRPRGSVFEAIHNLRSMSPSEAAGTIMERRIPFLIAKGALGERAKEPELVLALIDRMSPTELVTNSKLLEGLGIKTVPALRAAYEQALGKAATSKKATLKTTQAAEAIEDEGISQKLRDLQEKQIASLGGVDGNWLVLGDKSGSMSQAIEVSRMVSATLAKMVKGNVHLVFFDTTPRYTNVTGKTYEEIKELTKHVVAGGGTSIGCGLLAIVEKHLEVDGIAIVSDGGENTIPYFHGVYAAYSQATGRQVPVYLYRTAGDSNHFSTYMKNYGFDVQVFDMTGTVDYYSLPNMVQTMRTQRYSLVDEIMEQRLLTLEDVFAERKEKVLV
jgi:hypothetical protein